MKIWLLIAVFLVNSTQNSFAQELETYVPPPLFGNSHLEEPGTRPDNAVIPPAPKERPQSKDLDVAPIPASKPKPSIPKAIKLNPTSPVKQGVVKGPKTMPAVKKQTVEAEVTYEPKTIQPKNLIQRHEEQKARIKIEKAAPKKLEPIAPTVINKKEWVFEFSDNQTSLDENQKLKLMKEIIPTLDLFGKARILIYSESYSQKSTNMNASRRLALSRALSFRKYLTDQEISPSRIDVRAIKAPEGSASPNIVKIKIIE